MPHLDASEVMYLIIALVAIAVWTNYQAIALERCLY